MAQEVIRRKRDGETLDDTEIKAIVNTIASGSITDGQIAAFSMAVFFQGMCEFGARTRPQRGYFRQAREHSGLLYPARYKPVSAGR